MFIWPFSNDVNALALFLSHRVVIADTIWVTDAFDVDFAVA